MINLSEFKKAFCSIRKIEFHNLKKINKHKNVVFERNLFYLCAKKLLPKIGTKTIGRSVNRSHSTVVVNRIKFSNEIKYYKETNKIYLETLQQLNLWFDNFDDTHV